MWAGDEHICDLMSYMLPYMMTYMLIFAIYDNLRNIYVSKGRTYMRPYVLYVTIYDERNAHFCHI